MARITESIRILEPHEMQSIHEGAVAILESVGMWIDHEEALDYLEAYGCQVDRAHKTVKFPAYLVEETVDKLRKSFTLEGRKGKTLLTVCERVYFSTMPRAVAPDFSVSTGAFTPFVLDLEEKRRPASIQDVRDSIRLADALENIDIVGVPCSAQEIPPIFRPVLHAAELVKNTDKAGAVDVWTKRDLQYIARIASVVRGGEEELRKRPLLVGHAHVRSPLSVDHNMAEIFVEYIKLGMPQVLSTMPCGGATAPASSAGVLAQGLAETIGGLVLGYSVDPDALVSIGLVPSLADMAHGTFPYSGPDVVVLAAAASQMLAEFYGRPGGGLGAKTDSCVPGMQAGMEKMLSILLPVLAGARSVGSAGHLEKNLYFSYEQLVIDDEIARYVKRLVNGFEVDKETLALDVIREVGIGGNFLAHEHTARNFRKEFWLSSLTERLSWASWTQQELRGMEERARQKARTIITQHQPTPLGKEAIKEIDKIVEHAKKEFLS